MTQANWSDDRVEQLKTLWTEGLSASQIARALGGVTRNAVIGKVHRLGLAGRASPAAQRAAPPADGAQGAQPAQPCAAPPRWWRKIRCTLDDGNHATVLTISDRMCRWPIGDPAADRIPFLRPLAQVRFALLRGPCPQGLSAAAAAPRQGQGPDDWVRRGPPGANWSGGPIRAMNAASVASGRAQPRRRAKRVRRAPASHPARFEDNWTVLRSPQPGDDKECRHVRL